MPDNRNLADIIEQYLLDKGEYVRGMPASFDISLGIDSDILLSFIAKTHAEEWEYIKSNKGEEEIENFVLHSLCQVLPKGHLEVLQGGFQCLDKTLRVLETPETSQFTVFRNFKYAQDKEPLDLMLNVNGLPVVTVLTSQDCYKDAIHRYLNDINPDELLFRFNQRTLVHFAVGPHEVYVSTRLQGRETFFTPFNLQKTRQNGEEYGSDYLWKKILLKENLLDIVCRFMSVQIEDGKKTIFFPLYHPANWVERRKSKSVLEPVSPPLPASETQYQIPVLTEAESYLSSPDPVPDLEVSEVMSDDPPAITGEDGVTGVFSIPIFSDHDEKTEVSLEKENIPVSNYTEENTSAFTYDEETKLTENKNIPIPNFSTNPEEATRVTRLSDRASWEKKMTAEELVAAINSSDLISFPDDMDTLKTYLHLFAKLEHSREGWAKQIRKLIIDVIDFIYIAGSKGEQIEEIIRAEDADLFKTFTGVDRDNFMEIYRSGIISNDHFNRVIWQFREQDIFEPVDYILAHLNTEEAAA